jgi:cytochrome P450
MSAFTDKALREYSSVLESHIDLFIRKLQDRSQDCSPLDLVSWFNFLTFDISGTLSFGESFGSVEAGRAHPWVAISCAFGKGITMVASLNFLGLIGGPFGSLLRFAIPKAARERMVYHRQLTEEKVGRYLDSSSKKDGQAAFLDAALRFRDAAKHDQDEEVLTKPELAINMSILIFAGSETSSSALSAVMRYLLRHEDSLAGLVKEIRTSFTLEQEINANSVSKLDFLTACINESMGMSHPVVIGVPRIVPKGGAWICEKRVPEGVSTPTHSLPRLPHSPFPLHHPPTSQSHPSHF